MPERRILASLLTDNSLIADCGLAVDDFTEEAHRDIYRAIQTMAMQRKPFDGVTLGDRLEQITGKTGWDGILSKMVQDLPTTANFLAYVELVKEKSRDRRLGEIAKTLDETRNGDLAVTQIMALEDAQKKGGKVVDILKYAIEGIERTESGGNPGVMTGLKDLDEKLGGLHKSDLVVIGGRTSMGKTAVMLNMANGCDASVGIISGEQSLEQIGQRFLALNGNISVHRMRNGSLRQDDWKRACDVLSKMAEREIYINDKPSFSLLDVQREARRWKHHHNIGVLFVDYLQNSIEKSRKRLLNDYIELH